MAERLWSELTTEEKNAVLGLYYYELETADGLPSKPPMTVTAMIKRYSLAAALHNFPRFLPPLVSDEVCERCEGPLEYQALSQAEYKKYGVSFLRAGNLGNVTPNISHIHPGLTRAIYYRWDRFTPCAQCGHREDLTIFNCPCNMCADERTLHWQEQARKDDIEERRRAAEEAARHQAAINWRIEIERCASELSESPLPDEVKLAAELLIRSRAKVEEDGGLWITIGWSGALPEELRDPWSDRVMDSWTVLAHLQIRGLIRRVMPHEYTPEPQMMLGELDRYLVTCGPDRARELKLISPTMAVEWRAARSEAQPQSG